MKKLLCLFLLPVLISACTPTAYQNDNGNGEAEQGVIMLKDIAYDKIFKTTGEYTFFFIKVSSGKKESTPPGEYTVHIKEGDSYEPFLVIESDYDGGVLLLRKHVLDETTFFNPERSQGSNGGYYPASNVDTYLNTVYFPKLSPELQDEILDTDVNVSTLEGVSTGDGTLKTENVQRKIFLLSATELNIKSGNTSIEGCPLAYFDKMGNWITTNKNGEARNYWLRSAYHWSDIQAWAIGTEGSYGGPLVAESLSMRPAFCLPLDTPIHKEDIDGESVYVVSQ